MKILEDLYYFFKLVRDGSIPAAAKNLGVNRTTILHAIYRLEGKLNKKLLILKKTGPVLTEQGKGVYNDIVDHYTALESKLGSLSQSIKMSGHNELKIITTTGASSLLIMPAIKKFLDDYPDVLVSMETVDGEVDFKGTTADVGILPTVKDRTEVTMNPIFAVHTALYASEEYLAKHGTPKTTDDLKNHKTIGYYLHNAGYKGDVDWHLKHASPENVRLRTNSLIAVQYAAKLGMGIINSTEDIPMYKLDLTQVLKGTMEKDLTIYFVTRRECRSAAVENFYACVRETVVRTTP